MQLFNQAILFVTLELKGPVLVSLVLDLLQVKPLVTNHLLILLPDFSDLFQLFQPLLVGFEEVLSDENDGFLQFNNFLILVCLGVVLLSELVYDPVDLYLLGSYKAHHTLDIRLFLVGDHLF